MSICAPTTPSELTELLAGHLHVSVDDAAFAATEAATVLGMTGPVVHMRLGTPIHCTCNTWADMGACRHALHLRGLLTHTTRQLRRANDWTDAGTGKPFPAEIKRAVAVANLLTSTTHPRLWPGMLPGHLRPVTPVWGEQA